MRSATVPTDLASRLAVALTLVVAAAGCAAPTRSPVARVDPSGARPAAPAAAVCLELVAAPLPATGPVVGVRRGAGSTCGRLVLELVARDVRDVFAASFDVEFDPALVRYESVDADGSFLAADGAETQSLGRAESGRAVIGVTRWKQSTGVDAGAAPALLARLQFVAAGGLGDGAVRFEPASLLGSEMPPRAKPEVRWIGGLLRAVPDTTDSGAPPLR